MVGFISGVHILVSVLIVLIVLIQQGKGSELGATFGGAGQSMFGPRGAANVVTKLTYILAAAFVATSLFLAYMSAHDAKSTVFDSSSSKATAPATVPGNSALTDIPPAPSSAAATSPVETEEATPAAANQAHTPATPSSESK